MKRTLTLLLLTSLVVSAGVYTYLRQPDIVPEVRTATVSTGDVIDSVGATGILEAVTTVQVCLLYTSPSPRDATLSRMPSSS